MKLTINKLALTQETLRNLTIETPGFSTNPKSNNSCPSVCGLPCTPVM
jgi:hypothetical protein